jgi:hypothetical protein
MAWLQVAHKGRHMDVSENYYIKFFQHNNMIINKQAQNTHTHKNNQSNWICTIFCALIICIKCIKDQQMHFNFIDVLLLYYGYQHVLATLA